MRIEQRRRRLRAALIVGVGALVTALALVLALTDPLRQLELETIDARFELSGRQPPPPQVVDVHIDDRTFDELGEQWPFPRGMHGVVIDRLRRAGAKVIAYDIQFTESTTEREDAALMNATTRAGSRVVLATTEVTDSGGSNVFGGPNTVRATGAHVGNTGLPADRDGVIRQVAYELDGMKTFSATAAELALGRPLPPSDFKDNFAWIDFQGPPGAIPTVSFSRVYNGEVDPELFRGKVVVIGMSAPSQQDVHSTSVGGDQMMSGAEIQANAISTLLRGAPLREAPDWAVALIVVALGMLCPLAALKLPRRVALVLVTAVLVVYPVLALQAFRAGLILPLIYPLFAVLASAVAVLGVAYVTSSFERERVRELFSRFVPESIVDQVIEDGLCLGGRRLQGTVMFCDIRGFTEFAELRPAEDVIAVLNRYLSEVSEAVRDQGGTLLRFEGDGVLAGFGLPVEQIDHADCALQAVREMVGPRLHRLNDWVRAEGLGAGFRIGIGVDSGTVMSGNVGCDWRMEYTAIGDTVNTASRLEELTKETEYQVLISDNTRAMLRKEVPELSYVDAQRLRGKQVTVVLWTLGNGQNDNGATRGGQRHLTRKESVMTEAERYKQAEETITYQYDGAEFTFEQLQQRLGDQLDDVFVLGGPTTADSRRFFVLDEPEARREESKTLAAKLGVEPELVEKWRESDPRLNPEEQTSA